MNTLKKTLTALAFSILGLAFTAGASPIVTDWDFVVDTAFTDSNLPFSAGSNFNTDFWNDPTTLTWGDGDNGPSSISIGFGVDGHVEGTIATDGGFIQSSELTHSNNSLDCCIPWLTSAEISTALWLSPTAPFPYDGSSGGYAPALAFGIDFTETNNFVDP